MKIVKLAAFGFTKLKNVEAVKGVIGKKIEPSKIIPLADKLKFAMKDIGKC
jgi:hypothetical protein